MKNSIAAVTGGFGLVGSQIVEELVCAGWQVKILSRIKRVSSSQNVTVIQSDLNDPVGLKNLLEGVDAIFHCAAELIDEKKMYLTNVEGTRTLLDVTAQTRASFFCLISSAGVISSSVDNLITEETDCNPKNTYEKTKYKSELLVKNANLNMSVCILRPTNVVSSLRPGVLMLPILNGWKEKLKVKIKGQELAHIVYAKDVARVAMFCLNKKIIGVNVFFISIDDDKNNNILDIYKEYLGLLNKKNRINLTLPVYIPFVLRKLFRRGDLHGKVAFSNKKLKKFGFEFKYSVQDILREIHKKRGG